MSCFSRCSKGNKESPPKDPNKPRPIRGSRDSQQEDEDALREDPDAGPSTIPKASGSNVTFRNKPSGGHVQYSSQYKLDSLTVANLSTFTRRMAQRSQAQKMNSIRIWVKEVKIALGNAFHIGDHQTEERPTSKSEKPTSQLVPFRPRTKSKNKKYRRYDTPPRMRKTVSQQDSQQQGYMSHNYDGLLVCDTWNQAQGFSMTQYHREVREVSSYPGASSWSIFSSGALYTQPHSNFPYLQQPSNFLDRQQYSDFPGRQQYSDFPGRQQYSDFSGWQLQSDFSGRQLQSDFSGRQLPSILPGRQLPSILPGRQLPSILPGRQQHSNFPDQQQHSNFPDQQQHSNFPDQQQHSNFPDQHQHSNFPGLQHHYNFPEASTQIARRNDDNIYREFPPYATPGEYPLTQPNTETLNRPRCDQEIQCQSVMDAMTRISLFDVDEGSYRQPGYPQQMPVHDFTTTVNLGAYNIYSNPEGGCLVNTYTSSGMDGLQYSQCPPVDEYGQFYTPSGSGTYYSNQYVPSLFYDEPERNYDIREEQQRQEGERSLTPPDKI